MPKESPLVNALKRVARLLDGGDVMLSSIQAVKDSEQSNGNETMIEVQVTVLVTPERQVQEHF